ncbi:sulfatase [Halorientalis regularis]|uniref:Arylsulfatase n=1 Tax=Halorientalis regularis TaxID=660518 RepID=A0A1G7T366_9EURY|nr:sulfatase [Halorientalis regularis]SDG29668.1 arylsulfatase [Halorientalis regularis]
MPDGWDNIVLLTADALRADHLSCYGYDRETTPELDEFAADALRFTAAHSVSSHTREGVPGLLTGQYPDGAIDESYHLVSDSLAATLSRSGFATGGFHSNPYVSRAYDYDVGFDTFDDDLHLGQNKLIALAQRALDKLRNRHYARADEINDRALSWLDSLDDRPFFLWNHYMDVHGPYEPPEPFESRYLDGQLSASDAQSLFRRAIRDPNSITDDERQTLLDLYDAEIAYNDHHIGQFLDALRERGLLSESLVIFTADHGEAFGEHGYYSHPRYLDDELTHVPMLLSTPETNGTVVETPVSTIDIVSTVHSELDLGPSDLPGRSLLAVGDGDADRAVYQQARGEGDDANRRRYAVRTRDETCRCSVDETSGDLTFDDVGDDSLRDRLEAYVTDRLANCSDADSSDTDRVTDDTIERRLEALGYKD